MENTAFYNNYPCIEGPESFICPIALNFYGYSHPMYRIIENPKQSLYNFEGEIEIPSMDKIYSDADRTPRDVERVLRMIQRDARAEIRELQKNGITSKLLAYFIASMVSYIDRNYAKYTGTFEQKQQEVLQYFGNDLVWIFDIFRTFGISPEVTSRFMEAVATTSIRNLRPAAPMPSAPSGHTASSPVPRY